MFWCHAMRPMECSPSSDSLPIDGIIHRQWHYTCMWCPGACEDAAPVSLTQVITIVPRCFFFCIPPQYTRLPVIMTWCLNTGNCCCVFVFNSACDVMVIHISFYLSAVTLPWHSTAVLYFCISPLACLWAMRGSFCLNLCGQHA